MAWEPSERDHAAGGLVQLLARPAWTSSRHADPVRAVVGPLTSDPSPVVRMRAAPPCRWSPPTGPPEGAWAAIGAALGAEQEQDVVGVLVGLLAGEAHERRSPPWRWFLVNTLLVSTIGMAGR